MASDWFGAGSLEDCTPAMRLEQTAGSGHKQALVNARFGDGDLLQFRIVRESTRGAGVMRARS